MTKKDIKELLEDRYLRYNIRDFLDTDPIQIPHRFNKKEDIEIAAFLTATISWGNRKSIINNANALMRILDDDPYSFILNHKESDLKKIKGFVHRTFQEVDLLFFISALKRIYTLYPFMEDVFNQGLQKNQRIDEAIDNFRYQMLMTDHLKRSEKHISSPAKGSSAKRLNMFLRWMVRKDAKGVDFGIWDKIPSSALEIPLDVHTACVSRKLGILKRKQQDWKSVKELGEQLRKFDSEDPIKYDFALFGLGVFEGFCK